MRSSVYLFIGLVSACADAGGEVSGGGLRFDAQSPIYPDVATNSTCTDEITWSSLYRDYFGPSSRGKCSGGMGDESNCHLDAQAVGSMAGGWISGPSSQTCYQAFKDTMVPPKDGKDHYFEAVLRQPNVQLPGGNSPMPLRPGSAAYEPCDMDRIRKWAKAGAKND